MSSARVLLVEYIRLLFLESDHGFQSDVEPLLRQHGIAVGRLLGQGLHGTAFEMGPDRVIKVSVAKDAAAAARHVKDLAGLRQKNSPAIAAIYDVGVLGPVHLSDDRWVNQQGIAFYYVMERLFPLPADEVKLAVRLLNELVGSPADEKKVVFVARRVFKRDGEDVGIIDRTLQVFHALQVAGIHHRDINSGVLMANKAGEYKLVDMESASVFS